MALPKVSCGLDDLLRLQDALETEQKRLADEKRTAAWWCVAGYRDIIRRAIVDLKRHEHRAVKVYGESAVLYDAALDKREIGR